MTKTIATDEAQKLIRPLHGALRLLLQELVRTRSVATLAGGNETPAQQVLVKFFREHGLQSDLYETAFILQSNFPNVRKHKPYAGRKNLLVRLHGNGRGRSLLLNGHIDTVTPGAQGWSRSPWSGIFHGGKVHGLGSFDMKGGLVANAAVVCALQRAKIRPGGDILFESVVDEEWGGGGGTIAARLRGDTADACVIPEGTQLDIYRATRGGFVVDLSVTAGDTSQYFSMGEVLSPAMHIGRLLEWIADLARERSLLKPTGAYAGFPDPAPVQIMAVESNRIANDIPLSVPLQATVRAYFQFLPEEDVDGVILDLQRRLKDFCASDPFFGQHPVQWTPVIGGPLYGHELEVDHPWARCLQSTATAALGRHVATTAAPYPCDAGLIHRDFGIPTLLFGPVGAGAHNPDEYVDFESVIQTAEVLVAAALQWTNG